MMAHFLSRTKSTQHTSRLGNCIRTSIPGAVPREDAHPRRGFFTGPLSRVRGLSNLVTVYHRFGRLSSVSGLCMRNSCSNRL
jgi:hypothetical protein